MRWVGVAGRSAGMQACRQAGRQAVIRSKVSYSLCRVGSSFCWLDFCCIPCSGLWPTGDQCFDTWSGYSGLGPTSPSTVGQDYKMYGDDQKDTIRMKDGRALAVKLGTRLGFGTHGTVYQASLTRKDRLGEMQIAVKLGRGAKTSEKEIERSREYQLLRGVAHPSIITVVEWFGAEDMDHKFAKQLLPEVLPLCLNLPRAR